MRIDNEIISGVGALIVTQDQPDRGFVSVVEQYSKRSSNKLVGMRTLPMETIKLGETHQQVLERLLYRPQGGEELILDNVYNPDNLTEIKLGKYELTPGVVLHSYLLEVPFEIDLRIGTEVEEVGEIQWTKIEDVLNTPAENFRFRPAVYEVLKDYLRYLQDPHSYVVGEYCFNELKNRVPTYIFDLIDNGFILAEDVFRFVVQGLPLPQYGVLGR